MLLLLCFYTHRYYFTELEKMLAVQLSGGHLAAAGPSEFDATPEH